MNILFITHHTRTRAFSRIGNLAHRVAARGHRVTLLCISDTARVGIKEESSDGVRYIQSPDLLPGKLRTGWDPWDAMNRLWWLNKHHDFELVHAFETRPATIHPLQWMMRKKKIPLVIDWIDWWGRGGIITTNRPRWYQILFGGFETFYEEHFRTLADATTVICTALGKRAEGLGITADSIFKVPLGADTKSIPYVAPDTFRSECHIPSDQKILMFSALDAVMDVELVFDAVKKVIFTDPDVLLVMTGNGKDLLDRRAREAGLESHFLHLGRLDQDHFVKALTCADLFLLPMADTVYNRGRWPSKIGDYLAAGRPIVANPVGEVKAIMEKREVGILCLPEPADMAHAIGSLLNNPLQCETLGKEARRTAETDLNWEHMLDTLEQAYEYATAG